MPKFLIIPDVHNKVYIVDALIAAVDHDIVVMLGDYFDDYNDDYVIARNTSVRVKNWIDNDYYMLLGNHDMSYMAMHLDRALWCPGYSKEKAIAINDVISPRDWKKLLLHYYIPGCNWLFTHAGFDRRLLETTEPVEPVINPLSIALAIAPAIAPAIALAVAPSIVPAIATDISLICNYTLRVIHESLDYGKCPVGKLYPGVNNVLGAGVDRGGDQPVGGIIWADYSELDTPVGINQCFGHTPGTKPRMKTATRNSAYTAMCIDTHMRHYAILDSDINKFTVHRVEI